MYSNTERLTELLGEAYNSAGAGAEQFEKTQESLESKLNNLHTAWTTFTTSIADSNFIKGTVDLLTLLLNTVNKLTDAFGMFSGAVKVALVVLAGKRIKNSLLPILDSKIRTKAIERLTKQGYSVSNTTTEAANGTANGTAYAKAYESAITRIREIYEREYSAYQMGKAKGEATKLGQAKAEAENKAYYYTNEKNQVWQDAQEAVRAKQQGTIKGIEEEKARQEAIAASRRLSAPARIIAAFGEGVAEGGSYAKGFKSAWAAIKTTSLFTKFLQPFTPVLLAVLVPALVGAFSSGLISIDKIAQAWQTRKNNKAKEENEELLSQYQTEIASLEAIEDKSVGEKNRLEYLKQQTEELEKQNKLLGKDNFEIEEQKRSGKKYTFYQQETVTKKKGREGTQSVVQTKTTPYEVTEDQVVEEANKKIKEVQVKINALDKNDENYDQKYQNYQNNIKYYQQKLQEVYDFYSQNFDNLDSQEQFEKLIGSGVGLGQGISLVENFDEDTYKKLEDLNSQGLLTDKTLEQLANQSDVLRIYLDYAGTSVVSLRQELESLDEVDTTSKKVKGYKDAADELKNIKTSVSAITDAVSGLYKNGYVDIEKLSTIVNDDAFNSLPSFESFFDILGKAGKEDIPQVTAAMEQLLAEYMASDSVLTSLNDSTAGLYKNMLVNMGVTNATEVVEAKLKQVRADEVVAIIDADNALGALGRTSHDVEIRLEGLAKQYGITEDALTAYIIKNRIANKNYLSTKASRQELLSLISVLGLTAEAQNKYNRSMKLIDYYESNINQAKANMIGASDAAKGVYEKLIGLYRDEINTELEKVRSELSKDLNDYFMPDIKVDPTQFDDTSKSTEKEIQKLSELYNAKKKVAAIEEKLSDLEEKRNVLQSYDAQRANENEQIKALEEQFNLTKDLIAQNEELRKQKLAAASTDWTGLYTYNELTHELELTKEYYNAINKNGKATKNWSADVLNNFKKWVEEYDDILDFSTEQENVLDDINTKLQEIWEGYRDNYIDLVNELAELFEQKAQKEIDTQKDKYDKMKDLDDKYLDELRKNIEARRDARDRENDVEDIAKKQKRLNMLMRDTSGRNASEIADLQKEIADAQQDLIDDDVDRVLDSLEDANDQQQENWDNAIEKLKDQLDQDKENGKFIRLAEETLQKTPAEIKAVFKDLYEEMDVLSQAELEDKLDDVTDKLVGAIKYRDDEDPRDATAGSTGNGANGNYTRIKYLDANGNIQTGYVSESNETYKNKNLTERIDQGSIVANGNKPGYGWKLVGNKGVEVKLSDEQAKALGVSAATKSTTSSTSSAQTAAATKTATISGTGGKGLNMRSAASSTSSIKGAYTDGTKVEVLDDSNSAWWKVKCKGQTGWMSAKYLKYAQGGLVDYTGPAWVDGNPSKPEAFLNAQDTKNFTELKELLASLLRESGNKLFSAGAQTSGDCNIYITVDQIASDYDIDEAVARVKQEIMSGSNYRNVNLINRRR